MIGLVDNTVCVEQLLTSVIGVLEVIGKRSNREFDLSEV